MMKKSAIFTLIISLTVCLNWSLFAQEFPNFEAELQALEKNNLQAEELQMRNADAVTDVITDDVSTGLSGLKKDSSTSTDTDTDETIMMTKSQKERIRRIRSRP